MCSIQYNEYENDPYFLAYNIFLTVLKSKDINSGMEKSLYLLKMFFNADDVILYKLDENGDFVHKFNQPMMIHDSTVITAILNAAKDFIVNRKMYQLNISLENLHNITFFNINLDNSRYALAISGTNDLKNIDDKSVDLYIQTITAILYEMEKLTELKKSAEVDLLTGLSNRAIYEKDTVNSKLTDGILYCLFDLFRLKNINDNYSHAHGDEYIKKTAMVLKKYFPKFIYTRDVNGKSTKVETGSCLYRIGGDEFVLISNSETYESAMIKMKIVQEEVRNLDIGVSDFIGINYGLVVRKNNETFRDLYLQADALLSENKRETYRILGLDRRR